MDAQRRKTRVARETAHRGAAESPIDLAKAALQRFRRAGEIAAEGTTPERLLRAAGTAKVEAFSRTIEVERDGRIEHDTFEGHRIRIEDSPLARLRARHLLATGADSATRSALLAAAADRYRLHWHSAGLAPLRAADPSRERVSGGGAGLLCGERQIAHFQAYGAAVKALSADTRRVVEAIVLMEHEPVDVGREMSGYKQDKQATAVALYLLRAGLAELAVHFGLIGRSSRALGALA